MMQNPFNGTERAIISMLVRSSIAPLMNPFNGTERL
jgi:hypothetical protein